MLIGLAANLGDIAFFEEHEAARDRQQRGHIGGHEILIDAETDDDGTALARHHDALGIRLAHHRQRIGAVQFGDRLAHRREQIRATLPDDDECDEQSLRCRFPR